MSTNNWVASRRYLQAKLKTIPCFENPRLPSIRPKWL